MKNLSNKVILITGATKGIGAAIARNCIEEGAQVMITGLEEDLAKSLCTELGSQSSYQVGNLADSSFCTDVIQYTFDKFGKLDGLVNNAALIQRDTLDQFQPETFLEVMKVNVLAPLLLIKAATPFLENTRGSIVNIGSTNALCGEENQVSYSASKAALVNVTQTVANYFSLQRKGIRVNHLNVGWVLTEAEIERKVADGFPPGWQNNLPESDIPFGRMILPEDIAHQVVFWLSDKSFPATGAIVTVSQNPYKKKTRTSLG
ncbi:SDR family oxidoreductase [Cyanobacteria bacterium FACHB-502]|nr:SDR family oxidoreductase [Cyanobacteria bacterium FACHB-502]